MKKRLLAALAAGCLVLSGCAMRTVEQMYAIPRRSSEYNSFQSAMDDAMREMEYAAPTAGENRQSLQCADLNGDGVEEYLVFARDTSGKKLHILIFQESREGEFSLTESLEASGTSFDQVIYANVDDDPGLEMIVGTQISNQVMGNAMVYSFSGQSAEQLLTSSYSRMLARDMDADGREELMLIRQGDGDSNAAAILYDYRDGGFSRSQDVPLSLRAESIRRIRYGKLQSGEQGVYISGLTSEEAVMTDVLVELPAGLINAAMSGDMGAGFQPLLNYNVYCEDIDGDGVLEFPSPVLGEGNAFGDTGSCIIDWHALSGDGQGVRKCTTFHDYSQGWYMYLNPAWADRIWVSLDRHSVTFSVYDSDSQVGTPVLSIYCLSGKDRDTQATAQGRFMLFRGENTVYAGKLDSGAEENGITEQYLMENFHVLPSESNDNSR